MLELIDGCEEGGWHYLLMQEKGSARAVFQYGDDKVDFAFDLFCEVGAPFQPVFQKLLRKNGLMTSFDEPGVFDRLVPVESDT